MYIAGQGEFGVPLDNDGTAVQCNLCAAWLQETQAIDQQDLLALQSVVVCPCIHFLAQISPQWKRSSTNVVGFGVRICYRLDSIWLLVMRLIYPVFSRFELVGFLDLFLLPFKATTDEGYKSWL